MELKNNLLDPKEFPVNRRSKATDRGMDTMNNVKMVNVLIG